MRVISINRVFSSLFMITVFILFNGASCESTQEELCEGSAASLNEATFAVKVQIEYSDFVPFEGPVRLRIFKTYCEGDKSGDFTRSGNTDENGLWDPHYQYFYKFGNLYDKVTVEWYISDANGEHLVHSRDYDYNAASSEMWIINSVQVMILPWKSTD